jgi:hypothetical protein
MEIEATIHRLLNNQIPPRDFESLEIELSKNLESNLRVWLRCVSSTSSILDLHVLSEILCATLTAAHSVYSHDVEPLSIAKELVARTHLALSSV